MRMCVCVLSGLGELGELGVCACVCVCVCVCVLSGLGELGVYACMHVCWQSIYAE